MRQLAFRTGAVLLAITAIAAAAAQARTWRVNADGSADALTIQAGVNLAAAGDSVLVAPGTYVEGRVLIERPIALIGEQGAAVTTLDRNGAGDCMSVKSQGMTIIEGLSLVGAEWSTYGYNTGRALSVSGNGVPGQVSECAVSDCVIDTPRGLSVHWADAVVTDCDFVNGSPVRFWSWIEPGFLVGYLTMERCRFSGSRPDYHVENQSVVHLYGGVGPIAEIRDCAFEQVAVLRPLVGYDVQPGVSLLVERCLFVENGGPAVAYARIPVTRTYGGPTDAIVTIRNNTVVGATGYSLTRIDELSPWSTIEQNCVVGGQYGIWVPDNGAQATIGCNLVWGNGTNWVGIPDPTGTNGNLSAAPKFCDGPSGDFTVAENSPLLAANNSCGVPIGAFGRGCGPLSIDAASWGRIKGWYRE